MKLVRQKFFKIIFMLHLLFLTATNICVATDQAQPEAPTAQPSGQRQTPEFKGWKVFKCDSYKVRFIYPENWVEKPISSAVNAKFLVELKSPDNLLSANLMMFSVPASTTLAVYKNQLANEIKINNASKNSQIMYEVMEANIARSDNGQEIYESVTRSSSATDKVVSVTSAILDEGHLYQLTVTCLATEFTKQAPLAVHIVRSLKIPSRL